MGRPNVEYCYSVLSLFLYLAYLVFLRVSLEGAAQSHKVRVRYCKFAALARSQSHRSGRISTTVPGATQLLHKEIYRRQMSLSGCHLSA